MRGHVPGAVLRLRAQQVVDAAAVSGVGPGRLHGGDEAALRRRLGPGRQPAFRRLRHGSISKGVRPSLERASALAPLDSSRRTLAASPAHHIRGVAAKSLAMLGSAPASSGRRTLSRLPSAAAHMSCELPRALRMSLPRVARSSFRMGRWNGLFSAAGLSAARDKARTAMCGFTRSLVERTPRPAKGQPRAKSRGRQSVDRTNQARPPAACRRWRWSVKVPGNTDKAKPFSYRCLSVAKQFWSFLVPPVETVRRRRMRLTASR